jgi:hypothetical protein
MKQRRAYPSDISDARWALIEPTLTALRVPESPSMQVRQPGNTRGERLRR